MINQTTMGIYPPSTSGTVVIPYVHAPTSLSSDPDTNELTENCYMAAAYFTVGECMLKDNDQRASFYTTLYEREIRKLKHLYGGLFDEDEAIEPHESYL